MCVCREFTKTNSKKTTFRMNQFGKMMKTPRNGTGMKVTPFVLPFPLTFIGEKRKGKRTMTLLCKRWHFVIYPLKNYNLQQQKYTNICISFDEYFLDLIVSFINKIVRKCYCPFSFYPFPQEWEGSKKAKGVY